MKRSLIFWNIKTELKDQKKYLKKLNEDNAKISLILKVYQKITKLMHKNHQLEKENVNKAKI